MIDTFYFLISMGGIFFFYMICNILISYSKAKAIHKKLLIHLEVAKESNQNLEIKVGFNKLLLPHNPIIYREGLYINIENFNSNSITSVKYSDIGKIFITSNKSDKVIKY